MTFSIDDLRGLSRPDQLKAAAKYAGVDPKVMEGIWRTESSYGKKMLSPAGAQGHFGLMPKTRETWETRLGTTIDPNDFTQSLVVAAYQMKENVTATGNVGDALRMYNAGTNRSKWGNPETMAYAAKVLGVPFGQAEQAYAAEPAKAWNGGEFMNASFEQVMYGRGNQEREPKPVHEKAPQPRDYIGNLPSRAVDNGFETSDLKTQNIMDDEVATAAFAKAQHGSDLLGAAFREQSIFAAGARAIDRLSNAPEQGHATWLRENLDQVYKDADDDESLQMLLSSGSTGEYQTILGQFAKRSSDRRRLQSQDKRTQLMYGLAGSLLDPVNLGLGIATDGAFTAARMSGTTAMMAGKVAKGMSLYAVEGAVGGLEGSALLDLAGEHQGLDDYLMNSGAGATLGLLAGGLHLGLRGNPEKAAADYVQQIVEGSVANKAALLDEAVTAAGDGASKEQVLAKAKEIEDRRVRQAYSEAKAGVPDEHRMMPFTDEETLTADPVVQAGVMKKNNTDLVSDEGQQKVFAEIYARSDRINAENPTNEKGLTNVSGWLPGGESTAMTLLKSENPTLQAYAKVALENTTGAGGRRSTAAATRHIYQTEMQQRMFAWRDNYEAFRKAEGQGLLSEAIDPKKLKEYNRRVFYEVEARGKGNSIETDKFVLKGADMWEDAMDYALNLQKNNKTVGYGRLPDNAKGYMTHRLSVEKVVGMTPDQKRSVIDLLSTQFQELNVKARETGPDGTVKEINFDKEFSDKLAKQYLERAVHRQHGQFEVPVNLHEPQAADMLEDALEAMKLDKHQKSEIMGALARGGAGYTKGRLRMDMSAMIPDGNGGQMPLGDLFEQDISSLFHSYTMRVSGEAALARYGIMGTKGLKTVLDAALAQGNVSLKARRAFEQTANEFMNMRVGDKRHAWMDNLSVATSAARLGQAVVNQVGDYSNAVASLGVTRAFQAVGALPRLFKEVGHMAKGGEAKNPILKDLDHMSYVGMEDYASSRLFDVRDYDVPIEGRNDMGTFGRIVRNAANAQYLISGHRRLVAVQTRGMAEKILDKALSFVRDGKNDVALQDMGFGESLRKRIGENLPKIAEFDKNGRLTKLDLYEGDLTPEELMSIRQVVNRGAGQIVQRTFIGETAPWVHDSTLSLLYKFRTYSITAMEKQWSRNTMNHGHVVAFATLMGSMSWAVPLHMARVNAKTVGMSRAEADKYKEKNLNFLALGRATLNYAAASGLIGDIIDVGAGYGAVVGGDPGKQFAEQLGQSGRQGAKPVLGGTLAPPLGLVEDAWKASHGDGEKLFKLLPGSNMLPVQPFLNYATQEK